MWASLICELALLISFRDQRFWNIVCNKILLSIQLNHSLCAWLLCSDRLCAISRFNLNRRCPKCQIQFFTAKRIRCISHCLQSCLSLCQSLEGHAVCEFRIYPISGCRKRNRSCFSSRIDSTDKFQIGRIIGNLYLTIPDRSLCCVDLDSYFYRFSCFCSRI